MSPKNKNLLKKLYKCLKKIYFYFNAHRYLKPACLPIPPYPQTVRIGKIDYCLINYRVNLKSVKYRFRGFFDEECPDIALKNIYTRGD